MANTYLTRNMTTQGSSIKGTFSCWFKLSDDNLTGGFLGHYFSGSYLFDICMQLGHIEVADFRNSYLLRKRTTANYRDLNAWYHLYVAIDRSLGTALDRCKIYVNGERITDFQSTEDANYSQQTSGGHTGAISMNNDYTARVGIRYNGDEFDGSISHMHWVDGSVIDIAQFGSTDATTGEWKINVDGTVADYGTNGFFIFKDGNTITDQSSGGSYDFTSNGTGVTKTEDNPSNVFCTMNPLNHDTNNTDTDLYYGNTLVYPRANANYNYAVSTLGMPKGNGKFYVEAKYLQYDGVNVGVGIVDMNGVPELFYENRNIMDDNIATNIGRVILSKAGNAIRPSSTTNNYSSAWSNGDIISIAIDTENGAVYFGINGTWQNSGVPTSGSSKTGAVDISAQSWWKENSNWGIWCGDSATNHDRFAFNFGNGSFGNTSGYSATPTITSTAVSSAGTNASGIGIFEYDVPTGYTALSTKGLNL